MDIKTSDLYKIVKDTIDKSLEINDTPFNRAWLLKCEYSKKINEINIEEKKRLIKEYFTSFSRIKTEYLSVAYERYYNLLDINEHECEKRLKELYTFSLKCDNPSFVETCAISLLNFYMKLNKEEDYESFVKEFEKEYVPSENFEYAKAIAYTKFFAKFEKAEIIINNSNKSLRWKSLLFDYLCNTNQKDRVEKIYKKYFENDISKTIKYYDVKDDERLIEVIENYWQSNPRTLFDLAIYACACIKHDKVEKAYKICKLYYDKPEYFDGVLYINYFLADQKYNNKDISAKVRNKIIEKKELYSNIVLAAAYAIVRDKSNMYSCLKLAINESIIDKFGISEWPVFEEYRDEEKFKKIADVSELMNFERKIDFI